jgi:hypothetical protein
VALEGTKVKANASKHKAMSYARMEEAEKKLQAEVEALLAEAARVDGEEDGKYGKGRRGDELPPELARRESRLAKIGEAKAALEREAREEAEKKKAEVEVQLREREKQEQERGRRFGGRPPQVPDPEQAQPKPEGQRNFTDPDSRIMKDGATKEFVQAYNAQAAVDSQAQVIVAAAVTQEANDQQQLVPLLEQVKIMTGSQPQQATADAGYFSEKQVSDAKLKEIDLLVAPDRQKHAEEVPCATGPPRAEAGVAEQMRHKLRTPEGRAVYKMRKAVVEPVFGQIKEGRGFRRFLLRGLTRVEGEWKLICTTHNLLKLFRSGWTPQRA